MKKWLKVALWILAGIVIVVFVGLNILTYREARKMIFLPLEERDPIEETCAQYHFNCEDVTVITADGRNLVGWYVPSQNGAVVMAQHGLGSDRQHVLVEAEILQRNGYGVLMTTLRAHDLNDDEVFTWGKEEMMDYQAWYDYLLTRNDIDPEKVGLYGESLGGALAIKFVSQKSPNIKAVIVHSAFSSMNDAVEMGVKYYAGLPAFPFAPMIIWWAERIGGFDASEINTKAWAADMCGIPLFILQGGLDDHIPAESGQWIYDAACAPKKLWFEPDAEHTGLDEPEVVDPAVYAHHLIKFYDCYLLGDDAACAEVDSW
jgi:fermentation-respiration switch protein FrsA (DUF1100 family)